VTTTNLDRQVERRLQDHDVRYTAGRHRVVAALAGSDGPRSAAELAGLVGTRVPISSLYRSLAVLELAGVIAPHFSQKGVARYELAEWLQGHHHHLVCIECGAVEDVSLSVTQETRVHGVVEEIAKSVAFAPVNHALEIEGRCGSCA
jgi:Fur family ferric uptake transcriptional regulator